MRMRMRINTRLAVAGLGAVLALASTPAGALMVHGGTGTQTNTAPNATLTNAWNAVGSRGVGSAVYLGNNWVITANHVGANDLNFGGSVGLRTMDTSVAPIRLRNSAGSFTDLILFRITNASGLTAIPIAPSLPVINQQVFMIGTGSVRDGSALQSIAITGGSVQGYYTNNARQKLWGVNTVMPSFPGKTTMTDTYDIGQGPVFSWAVEFGTATNEAQGIDGDSGGGVFDASGNLLGIMNAVDRYDGQPTNASLLGTRTYIQSLVPWRQQILRITGSPQAIPEPAALSVLAPAMMLLARRRRA